MVGFTFQERTMPKVHVTNMNEIVWYMIALLSEISLTILLLRFTKYLAMLLLSPMLTHISQGVEVRITGNKRPFSWLELVSDIKRSTRIVFRNIFWEYLFYSLFYIVALIIFKKPEESYLVKSLFVVSSFYYGFSFLDYTLERMQLSVNDSVRFMRKNQGLAISIGLVYSGILLIPIDLKYVLDWSALGNEPTVFMQQFALHVFYALCIAFAPIWSIVAATLAIINLTVKKEQRN